MPWAPIVKPRPRAFRDLVQRPRSGWLKSSEFSDPTITVTRLGERGVETVFGIVYPSQVHRVSGGHRGGLFLAAVDRLLQAPERL